VRPEESKALFDGYGASASPRRRGPVVAGAAAVLASGVAIGAGAYAWFERGRAGDAELARGQAATERDAALSAKSQAERETGEALAAAEKVAKAAAEAVALAAEYGFTVNVERDRKEQLALLHQGDLQQQARIPGYEKIFAANAEPASAAYNEAKARAEAWLEANP
jgi:hypothetical protein